MIIQFWLGAILLLIIASAIFVIPFLASKKTAQNNTDKRNELNRALYDVRVEELNQDDDQGLLIDKDKLVSELQHNLLDDINDEKSELTTNKRKLLWLPGLILLTFGSVAMYWSVGAYQEVSKWEESLQRYPALQDKLFNDPNSSPTEQELRDIMLGLRTQLANDPSDADGWLLYSRLGMVFKDHELSLDAIRKAYELNPQSIDIRLVFIQLKMQKGDEYSQQQAMLMLQQLLIDEPSEMQAWSMYAFMSLEKEDFNGAIKSWEHMLTLPGVSEEQASMLKDSIRYAQSQLTTEKSEATNTIVTAKIEQKDALVDAEGAPIYTVNIAAADNVTVPSSGFLIVYAQAVSGPKMPIAALKLTLTNLPVSVQISDANAMMEGLKLSDQSEFIIKARLSKSGDVMNKTGDWQGVSQVVEAGQTEAIQIIISEQL